MISRAPGLLQPDLLGELDRRHRGRGAEVPVKGRRAHPGQRGEVGDEHGLVVVLAVPRSGAGDVGEAAAGQADLPDQRALVPG